MRAPTTWLCLAEQYSKRDDSFGPEQLLRLYWVVLTSAPSTEYDIT